MEQTQRLASLGACSCDLDKTIEQLHEIADDLHRVYWSARFAAKHAADDGAAERALYAFERLNGATATLKSIASAVDNALHEEER